MDHLKMKDVIKHIAIITNGSNRKWQPSIMFLNMKVIKLVLKMHKIIKLAYEKGVKFLTYGLFLIELESHRK
ncbi:MAG UNVERIFIED_CONTAM: hypothetical protein LVQ98_09010 [Rickettsiaceae bacterium]|jgi:undecaprenyl pyrophosphate synthase